MNIYQDSKRTIYFISFTSELVCNLSTANHDQKYYQIKGPCTILVDKHMVGGHSLEVRCNLEANLLRRGSYYANKSNSF